MRKLMVAVVIGAILVSPLLLGLVQAKRAEQEAAAVLGRLKTIQLSTHIASDIERIAKDLDLPIQYFGNCQKHCTVRLSVDNGWLGRIELIRYTQLTVSGGTMPRVDGASGLDSFLSVSLSTTLERHGPDYSGVKFDQCTCDAEILEPRVHSTHGESGTTKRSVIRLGTLPMKPEYLQFNVSCLSQINGCATSDEIHQWRR
jgi:hypothetical protein